jgi:hypothetical protein
MVIRTNLTTDKAGLSGPKRASIGCSRDGNQLFCGQLNGRFQAADVPTAMHYNMCVPKP